jgi:hypothetical protein
MKKWFWRVVLIILVVGVVTAGLMIWFFLTHLKEIALDMLEQEYPNLEFQIGSLKMPSPGEFEAKGTSVRDREIDPDHSKIEIEKVWLIVDVFSNGPMFKTLLIDKPVLNINVVGDSVPIIGRLLKKNDRGSEFDFGLIEINGGKLNFSAGDRGVRSDFNIRLLNIPQLDQKQACVSLENIVIEDPTLLIEEQGCTLSFDIVQYGSSLFEVNNGMLNAGDAIFEFESDFEHIDNRLTGGIDFMTSEISFSDVAFLYEEHIPWQFSFDGKAALSGRAEIDIGDTISIFIEGDARIKDSSARYSIQSNSFEFEGIEAMAQWRLDPLAAPFGEGGLELDCALFMEKIGFGTYKIENVSLRVNILDEGIVIDNVVGSAYGGKMMGSGKIDITDTAIAYSLNMGILDFDAEALVKSLDPTDVYMTGMANGSLNWQGRVGEISRLNMELETDSEGGLIRIQDTEKFLNTLPGGEETVDTLQDSLGSREWSVFIKSMENYQYKNGSFKFELDPDNLELKLLFSFSSKSPTVGDRNFELVVHDIDKQLIPKITF